MQDEKAESKPASSLPPVDLPPVMGKRQGGFIVPDFLKNKDLAKDIEKVKEKDMFDEVLRNQEKKNQDEFAGMSMAEIAAKKRAETEK